MQKLKRESSYDNDPYLNQKVDLSDLSRIQAEDVFKTEMNTSSNRELRTGNNPFQIPFPNLAVFFLCDNV